MGGARLFEKRKAAKLQAAQRAEEAAGLRSEAARLPDGDGVISVDAFQAFMQTVIDRDLDLGSTPDVVRSIWLGLAQGGCFIAADSTLLLKREESALLEVPVGLLKEVRDRQFQGGSSGVSIPLGHGFRYRVGSVRGQMVTIGSHWETADAGQLTVTDQRVVYHGGRKTLEFPFGKLVTLNVYSDAIDLGVTSRQSTSSFATDVPDFVAGIIRSAVAWQDPGVTILKLDAAPGRSPNDADASQPPSSLPPAGWYQDPHGATRWWDGQRWTEHTG